MGDMGMMGVGLGMFAGLMLVVVLWTLVWKGLALWHAAKNGQFIWFVVLLLVNTVGILEIVYLIWFRKDRATRTFPSLFTFGTSKDTGAPQQGS